MAVLFLLSSFIATMSLNSSVDVGNYVIGEILKTVFGVFATFWHSRDAIK